MRCRCVSAAFDVSVPGAPLYNLAFESLSRSGLQKRLSHGAHTHRARDGPGDSAVSATIELHDSEPDGQEAEILFLKRFVFFLVL